MKVLTMIVTCDDEVTTTRDDDLELIESDLNDLLIHKYIYHSSWVKRVRYISNYDGTIRLQFTLDNKCKYEFLIKR